MLKYLIVALLAVTGASMILDASSTVQNRTRVDLPNIGAVHTNGKNLYPSIIALSTEGHVFCSGFVVDANYAITAKHCVDNAFGISQDDIEILNSRLVSTGVIAKAVSVDDDRDVAVIKGNFADFTEQKADFYGTDSHLGMMVTSCGFPGGGPMWCTDLQHIGNSEWRYRFRGGPLFKGMSGGPVVNKATGVAIGVNSAVTYDSVIIGPLLGARKGLGL